MTPTRTALVVGGSSGIGRATALALASDDAAVHVVGRDAARLADLAAKYPDITTHRADATVRAEIDAVLDGIGTVDWLVIAMSGAAGGGPLRDLDLDVLRGAFDAKFWGHLTTVQAALDHLSADASITFVTAISARASLAGTSGLAAVNGAIESLVKPLAVELAPIRVNAVSPGLVDTPWWDGMPADAREAYFARAQEALPVSRIAQPEDVAQALVFAATNPNLTGTVIESDGGARFTTL